MTVAAIKHFNLAPSSLRPFTGHRVKISLPEPDKLDTEKAPASRWCVSDAFTCLRQACTKRRLIKAMFIVAGAATIISVRKDVCKSASNLSRMVSVLSAKSIGKLPSHLSMPATGLGYGFWFLESCLGAKKEYKAIYGNEGINTDINKAKQIKQDVVLALTILNKVERLLATTKDKPYSFDTALNQYTDLLKKRKACCEKSSNQPEQPSLNQKDDYNSIVCELSAIDCYIKPMRMLRKDMTLQSMRANLLLKEKRADNKILESQAARAKRYFFLSRYRYTFCAAPLGLTRSIALSLGKLPTFCAIVAPFLIVGAVWSSLHYMIKAATGFFEYQHARATNHRVKMLEKVFKDSSDQPVTQKQESLSNLLNLIKSRQRVNFKFRGAVLDATQSLGSLGVVCLVMAGIGASATGIGLAAVAGCIALVALSYCIKSYYDNKDEKDFKQVKEWEKREYGEQDLESVRSEQSRDSLDNDKKFESKSRKKAVHTFLRDVLHKDCQQLWEYVNEYRQSIKKGQLVDQKQHQQKLDEITKGLESSDAVILLRQFNYSNEEIVQLVTSTKLDEHGDFIYEGKKANDALDKLYGRLGLKWATSQSVLSFMSYLNRRGWFVNRRVWFAHSH